MNNKNEPKGVENNILRLIFLIFVQQIKHTYNNDSVTQRYTEKVSYTDDPVYASDDSVDSTDEVINADTLGGKLPEDYAPAGYGLGERAFNAPGNDANQITKCGFFRAYVNTPTGDWWTIQQEDLYGSGTYMIQKASCFAYVFVLHAERMVVDGKFYEWEWVNPPMELGVEYRTTERWNGEPVYTMLVDCGAMPNATIKRVYFGDGECRVVSLDYGGKLEGFFISKGHPNLGSWDTEFHAICMRASNDYSSTTDCWAVVKYVKI